MNVGELSDAISVELLGERLLAVYESELPHDGVGVGNPEPERRGHHEVSDDDAQTCTLPGH